MPKHNESPRAPRCAASGALRGLSVTGGVGEGRDACAGVCSVVGCPLEGQMLVLRDSTSPLFCFVILKYQGVILTSCVVVSLS